ncbi:transposase [uncultured Victivallis sp.]|uniref:transposase n=1 Tax=uncultured Victivallis sp. TaxID=354118 RepID=UPI00345921D5
MSSSSDGRTALSEYTSGMSDEAFLDEWLENPYWQYFTGGIYFEHEYPTDQSTTSR